MRNRGFSIVEVLFAVMILAIGFIMVAAMFPVAVQQTQANVDEVTARSVADAGVNHVATVLRSVPVSQQTTQLATPYLTEFEYRRANQLPNPTPADASLTPPVGAIYVRDLVNSATLWAQDSRYAWTVLYRCDANATNGKPLDLIAVALRATNASECSYFTAASDQAQNAWHAAYDNAAIPCTVDITYVAGAPAEISFNTNAQCDDAAVQGALVVIRSGTRVGQVFTLDAQVTGANRWQVAGSSPQVTATETGLRAFLIGRSLRNPAIAWQPNSASPAYNPREGTCPVIGYRVVHTALP